MQKEKFATSYLDFFNKLKKELLGNYAIRIEDDIQGFVNSSVKGMVYFSVKLMVSV